MNLVEKVTLSTLPTSSLQLKSQLTCLDNDLQNIINSISLSPVKKAQTFDQILKKYLALKQRSGDPSGGYRSFSEANELWVNLPPLPKDIQPHAYQLLCCLFKAPQITVNQELASKEIPQQGSNISTLLEAYINKDNLRMLLPGYDVFVHALKFATLKKHEYGFMQNEEEEGE